MTDAVTSPQLRTTTAIPGRYSAEINTTPIYPDDQSDAPTPQSDSEDVEEFAEKASKYEEEESASPEEGEIVYQYLTFETEVPTPSFIYLPRDDRAPPPPPQPDLTKYTSPFEWSSTRKSIIIWISCIITSLTAFTAGSYSPGIGQMTREWHVSKVAALVGITMFTCGFAVAPMVLAPFSEIQGRRPVFIATGLLFLICQLCTGLTQSYAGMLVVRFFAGVGGSTFSTMVGGVVSDIYHTDDRNKPMAIFSGGALFGTGFGPLVAGFIAQNTSWRWIFHVQTIVDGLMVAIIVLVFKETRGSVLLSRKAHALNKWYAALESAGYSSAISFPQGTTQSPTPQRIRWKVLSDEERSSLHKMIAISLYRPFHLLCTEPVVFFFSLWVAFSWAVLYLTLAAIPLVFQRTHAFDLQRANAVFAAISIGAVLATVLSIYQERLARSKRYAHTRLARNIAAGVPEARLYFACVESAFMPIGLFLFGWSGSYASVHWIVPAIAIVLATLGIFAIYLSTFNYLADTYHRYASSALAAQSFCRNMLGGAFPLITTQLYNRLGFGPASSLLGGIGLVLSAVPCVLVMYGPEIRSRSKFASGLAGG